MKYNYNAIYNAQSKEIVQVHKSRRYLRKICRRKYAEQYHKNIIIISGESKSKAMKTIESELALATKSKAHPGQKSNAKQTKSTKQSKGTKQGIKSTPKNTKHSTKKKTKQVKQSISGKSLLERYQEEEENTNARLNKKNGR